MRRELGSDLLANDRRGCGNRSLAPIRDKSKSLSHAMHQCR
jgi:hypothetical protein